MNKNFFNALQMEKTMLMLLMLLIVLVATFNIISSLFMVVSEKKSDIAILKTIGMNSKSIMHIFILQGTFLGIIGIILGLLFGLAITINLDYIVLFIESIIGHSIFDSDIYMISKVPVKIELLDLVHVSILDRFWWNFSRDVDSDELLNSQKLFKNQHTTPLKK